MVSRMLEESTTKPWGDVVLASFLVWLVTFVGLLLGAITSCITTVRHNHVLYRIVIPSFASGALLATCVFLLIPESLELLAASAGEGEDSHDHEGAAEAEFVATTTNSTNDTAHDDHDGHDHFLMYRYLQEGEQAHGEVHTEGGFAWKFGASLLGGFLFPILLHALFPSPIETCEECQEEEGSGEASKNQDEVAPLGEVVDEESTSPRKVVADTNEEEGRGDEEVIDLDANQHFVSSGGGDTTPTKVPAKAGLPRSHAPLDLPLICSILLGDFLHNFTDGIFLGTAFLLCSRDIAYTLVATTIYHEMAQELADFVVLTTHCGLPVWKAVVANAVSGVSVLLGGLVILATNLDDGSIGVILSISAGVYVYITACECVPKILAERLSPRQTLTFTLWFALGAVPIGLVLLNHGHCEASSSHDEEADHAVDELFNETVRWM